MEVSEKVKDRVTTAGAGWIKAMLEVPEDMRSIYALGLIETLAQYTGGSTGNFLYELYVMEAKLGKKVESKGAN